MNHYVIIADIGRFQTYSESKQTAHERFKSKHPTSCIWGVYDYELAPKFLTYSMTTLLHNAGLTFRQMLVVDKIIGELSLATKANFEG